MSVCLSVSASVRPNPFLALRWTRYRRPLIMSVCLSVRPSEPVPRLDLLLSLGELCARLDFGGL